ncbi:MAG: lipid A hydroxylase LpxO [Burkholderiaceae bacterium]
MKWFILALFGLSTIYVHRRGRERLGFLRQVSDHSTLFAPVNVLMYAFSRVPNTPYVPIEQFPELRPLLEHWHEIRDEALAMREAQRIRASQQYDDVGFNSFFRTGWKRFYLKWYDESHPSAATLCPRTTALLRGLPSVKAAMFAELPPGSHLVRHRDPYAGSLRMHLGLATPNDDGCFIEVDGQRYSWRDGEAVVFDETYLHVARNTTQSDRVILFCDIERPLRFRWAQAFNRWFGRHVMTAATSPNDAGDRTGGLNRVFGKVYAVRLLGKRLKAWNRTAYYLVKWALIGGLLALIFL